MAINGDPERSSQRGGFSTWARVFGAAEGLGTSLVVLALVAALVYAASRPAFRVRIDLTEGAHYTLTDQTKKILAGLERPVEIITVLRPEAQVIPTGLAAEQAAAFEYVRNLIEEYVVASGGDITVTHYDPFLDPGAVEVLKREEHFTRANVVMFRCGSRRDQVFLEELVTIAPGRIGAGEIEPAELLAYHGEGPLTSALLAVINEERPTAVFVTGHGEPSLDNFQERGLGRLGESLRGQGFEVSSVDLVGGASLPQNADVVAVVQPIQPLGSAAVAALLEYHKAGGALFLALAPWVRDARLDELLEELGAVREFAILTDDESPYEGPARSIIPLRRFDANHVITGPIHDQGVVALFPSVAGLNRAPSAAAHIQTSFLAKTEDHVFGDLLSSSETVGNFVFDGAPELRNSRFVAMAIEGDAGRAALFGSGAFALNASLSDGGRGNTDLLLNAFNWLIDREDAVAARPREVYESRVELYGDEKADIFLYIVVAMPLAGALLGVLSWFMRRR
jgi:hypothetical protein